MALLDILHYPDKRLRTIARPVEQVDEQIRTLVADMFETMYAAPGIGLAATQVDVHLRVIVIDISEDKNQPLCLINPQIVSSDGVEITQEGCLSVPEVYENVERAEHIKVHALDQTGAAYNLEAGGLLAVCIQHEMDHLVGKLFVDYLSPLKQQRLKKKVLKSQRQAVAL
jgi:peptide deformylase